MSLAIHWDPAALYILHRLRMKAATAVDRAVIRFAETGEGELDWEPPYHWLGADTHQAMLSIDLQARTVTVLRIYRRKR